MDIDFYGLLNKLNNLNFNFDYSFSSFLSYLISDELHAKLLPLIIAFFVITGVLLGIIIFILLRTHYLQWLFFKDFVEFFSLRPFGAKKITRQWNRILRHLETGAEPEYKLAIIEADDMLDASLRRMGYTGTNLEEKLGKLTAATIPNIAQVYEAHHLRDNIVHNPDYRLSLDEARKTLNVYDQTFRDLQILEK